MGGDNVKHEGKGRPNWQRFEGGEGTSPTDTGEKEHSQPREDMQRPWGSTFVCEQQLARVVAQREQGRAMRDEVRPRGPFEGLQLML